jgi:signal transduction histidine kinase
MREGPGLQVQFQLQGEPLSLTREQELNLYRVTQEALANVRAHSQASWAEVRLTYEVQHVLLEVLDGGVGFEPPSTLAELSHKGNYGLMGIQERVWASGGFLELESGSGQGTRLKVTLPYHSPSSLDPYGATQPTASGGHPRKV